MARQTGISFDEQFLDELRTIKAELQIASPGMKITNNDLVAYLIELHKQSKEIQSPKVA
jgi:hypothetical protein